MNDLITNNDIRKVLLLPEVDKEFEIVQVDQLSLQANTLMFINKPNIELYFYDKLCDNSVFLIDDSYPEYPSEHNDFIRVKNPKFEFCLLVDHFKLKSYIQRVYERAGISEDSIESIGDNCHFDEGVIIGGKDFSPVMGNDRSTLVQFPQMGGVRIGDNVVIKYNTMVGRGTFRYTEIDDNTMIDFGCQIGHNCKIGKSCIIAAGTIIGGSTTVGDNVTIGMGAVIRNGIHIGDNASIGMGSVVIKDVPDNCVVVGNPAHPLEHKTIFDERGLV